MYNTTPESYDTLLKRAKLTPLQNRRLQDILILMFKVKNKLTTNQIADIFNINDENTNSKRYNLRNADFVLPRFKTVTYGRHSLISRTTIVVKIKQGGEKYWNFGKF